MARVNITEQIKGKISFIPVNVYDVMIAHIPANTTESHKGIFLSLLLKYVTKRECTVATIAIASPDYEPRSA